MKKILFVCNNMELGGVQKSLVNLLKNICNIYDVSLLLFSDSGYYISEIPKNVKLIKTNKFLRLLGNTQEQTRKNSFLLYTLRGVMVVYSKLFGNSLPRKIIFSTFKDIEGYDIVISFTQDISEKNLAVGCNEFVIKKVKCKNKITFVHSDFSKYGGNSPKIRTMYKKFDKVVCVSYGCKKSLVKEISDIEEKTYVVYNFHDFEEIANKSKQDAKVYNREYFNIVTVARLTEEKGILRALSSIKVIIDKGHAVMWHIVGDGTQRQNIENHIKKYGLQNYVFLYGSDNNPYRYIKNADLFMLPSFHEAAPIVFGEAQALKVPILTTDTISAKEMVENNKVGFVCENNTEGIINSINDILSNQDKLRYIKKVMASNNNNNAIIQFEKLVDECL